MRTQTEQPHGLSTPRARLGQALIWRHSLARVLAGIFLCLLTFCAQYILAEERDSAVAEKSGELFGLPEEGLPKWEFGLGAGVLDFDHYVGSDQRHSYVVPVPYFIYRGDFIGLDRQSMRGKLYSSGRFRVDLAFGGSVPVDSSENDARRGMPNLGLVLQSGVYLRYRLVEDRLRRWELGLPVRYGLSVQGRVNGVGAVINPRLNYLRSWLLDGSEHTASFGFGVLFHDGNFNNYYYGVGPRYANSRRQAYDAPGGYAGWRLSFGYTLQARGNWWLGAYGRYLDLNGASFVNSPLVRTKSSLNFGLTLVRVLSRSSERVTCCREL